MDRRQRSDQGFAAAVNRAEMHAGTVELKTYDANMAQAYAIMYLAEQVAALRVAIEAAAGAIDKRLINIADEITNTGGR